MRRLVVSLAVVALTVDPEILLIRQFRYSVGDWLYEVPAGTRGEGEPFDQVARRELEEETGYRARTWRHLASFWTAPGFASELMHLYLATDLRPIADYAGPMEDERIALELLELVLHLLLRHPHALVELEALVEVVRRRDHRVGHAGLEHIGENTDRTEEGEADGSPGNAVRPVVRPEVPAEEAVGDGRQQREHRNQFDKIPHNH